MRKFIIKAGTLVIVLFVIYLFSYFFIPIKPNNYLMAYRNKCELLEKTPSPRIIFIGGSNLAFGLDSKRIKDSLGINVINYGLHAGIGLKYMIDDVSLYCKPGDILVFSPEWAHFYSSMYGQPYELSTIIKVGDFKKVSLLNYKQLISVITGIPSLMKQYIMPGNVTERTYVASNFNKYGDEEKHWSLDSRFRCHSQQITEEFDKDFGRYFINKLNKLQTKCKVIMIPPACCDVAMDKWNLQIKEVEKFLIDNGHPFIIAPDNCSFEEVYMYDTRYHLNKKGVDIRTSLVIDALKDHIKN